MRLPFVLLAAALLASGCLQPAPGDGVAAAPVPRTLDDALAGLAFTVRPDAERCLSDLEAFVELAPRRYEGQFQYHDAVDWLEQQLLDAGLSVVRQEFDGQSQAEGLTTAPVGAVPGINLLGIHPGRDPSLHPIVFGAHYDSAVTAYGAAYDDGSGTLMVVELARALAQYGFDHTLVFALWDQEEAGLVGARHYVANLTAAGGNVTVNLNFDMTGINWPAKVGGAVDQPLRTSFGGVGDEHMAELWAAAAAYLGYPAAGVTADAGASGGSSDHGAFLEAGLPAAWVRGALIGSYPAYHTADQVETMIVDVGGDRADLVAGFDTALQSTFVFTFLLDAVPPIA